MSIRFIKEKQRFVLHTKHTTYAFEVLLGRYLTHLYYGKRTTVLPDYTPRQVSFAPYRAEFDECNSPDMFLQEFSFFGSGDFRTPCLRLCGADGTGVTDFAYDSYRIRKGRPDLCGLPSARADQHTETLEILLRDEVSGCRLSLFYTVFPEEDIISRSIKLTNRGKQSVRIDKCMSLMLDMAGSDLDMVSLYGRHPEECNTQRHPLHHGVQTVLSRRGASSHQYNPFFALCNKKANDEKGDVWGFNFIYSGSFLNEVEVDQLGNTRVAIGLGSECFQWELAPKQSFTSPEAVMTYAAHGFGEMSRNFHNFVRRRILPPASLQPHPVVLNTWEACLFKIDESLLLQFADEASRLGFDMLVMDDGWFGERHNDRAGLGDWFENKQKFPNGLGAFVNDIKQKGIKFGIWVEPEMVNPDSDLYRAHPEWCLHVPGREPSRSRHQLVLDMANPDVIDYLIATFEKTLGNVAIDYFKWDMNRHLSDVGSITLPASRQGEVPFRYMLGVYRLLNWFIDRFPNAIIETCSGGGGRYDLGMMCYGFQIWTSDNTQPYARTRIQDSAMLAYPAATMSCHVSNPRGSLQSLDFRYKVAVGGMLGYELHILNMSDEIKQTIAQQIKEYHTFEHLARLGEYYRLASPVQNPYAAYYYTDAARKEILLTVIETKDCPAGTTKRLKIKVADPDATYTDQRTGVTYTGKELQSGLRLPLTGETETAILMYLKKN